MQDYRYLIDLNISIIGFFWESLGLRTDLYLQSQLGISGNGSELIINICNHLEADTYLNFPVVEKYLDIDKFRDSGTDIEFSRFSPPVYPQLWGDFIHNLSTLDMILNCGDKSREIISNSKE